MTSKEHMDIFSSTECLSESDLRGYAANSLSEQEKLRVEKHMVDCELCSDALEGYSLMNNPSEFELRTASIARRIDAKSSGRYRFLNREKLSYAAAAAVVLIFCSIVFVLIDNVSKESNQFVSDEIKREDYRQEARKRTLIQTPAPERESDDKMDRNQDVADQTSAPGKLEGSLKEVNKSETAKRSGNLVATGAMPTEPESDMTDEISLESSADRAVSGAAGKASSGWNNADNKEVLSEDVVLYDLSRSADERKDAQPTEKDKDTESTAGFYREGKADKATSGKKSKNKRAVGNRARAETEPLAAEESISQVVVSKSIQSSADYSIATTELLSEVVEAAEDKEPTPAPTSKSELEAQPRYKDGDQQMIQYLVDNIRYPDSAKAQGIEGTVMVQFQVEADSSITNVRSLNNIGGGCEEEAVRVVKSMKNWIPARRRGKPVSEEYNLPVKFKLKK